MKVAYKTTLVTGLMLACTGFYVGATEMVAPTQVDIPGVTITTKQDRMVSDSTFNRFVQKVGQAQAKELGGGFAGALVMNELQKLTPLLQSSTIVILNEKDADIRFHYPYASIKMIKKDTDKATAYATVTTGGVVLTEVRDMELPKGQEWDGKTIYYDAYLPYEGASEKDLKTSLVASHNRLGNYRYTEEQVRIGKFTWPNLVGATWDISPYGKEGHSVPSINFAFAKDPKTTYHVGGFFWNMQEVESVVDSLLVNRHAVPASEMQNRIMDKTGVYGLKKLGEEILPTIQEASSVKSIAREEKLGGLEYYVPLSFKLKNSSDKAKRVYVDQEKSFTVEMKKLDDKKKKISAKGATERELMAISQSRASSDFVDSLQAGKNKPFYYATVWNGEWPSVYSEAMVADRNVRQMQTITFDDTYRYTLTLSLPASEKGNLQALRDVVQTVKTDSHREEVRGEAPLSLVIAPIPAIGVVGAK